MTHRLGVGQGAGHRSLSVGLNVPSDGDNKSGGLAWPGDSEGSFDGYVAGDEASSPTQHV